MKLIRDKTVSAGKHAGAEEMDSKWGQGREEKWTDDTSHERGLLVEPRRIVKISVVFFFSLSLSQTISDKPMEFFFTTNDGYALDDGVYHGVDGDFSATIRNI